MAIIAILGIPLGLLMLAVGLKGILRMLGLSGPEAGGFYCGCSHETDEHAEGDRSCTRCPCPRYTSQLHLEWMASRSTDARH